MFSVKHDAILTDFLKKRRKTFNTDQRLLFGKNSNGYLFPLQLQLQRASFSSNDEFIFIARVTFEKLKSTPLYCLVDLEGEVKEHTSGFRNLFFSKRYLNHQLYIQEVIPNFFAEIDNIDPLKAVIIE